MGTGRIGIVFLIFREAEQLGLPEPEIIEIGMRVRLTIYLAKPINESVDLLFFARYRRYSEKTILGISTI